MLDIRIRIKKRLTPEDLRALSYIANEISNSIIEDKNSENVFEDSWIRGMHEYHFRVNIGHNIITFFDIT